MYVTWARTHACMLTERVYHQTVVLYLTWQSKCKCIRFFPHPPPVHQGNQVFLWPLFLLHYLGPMLLIKHLFRCVAYRFPWQRVLVAWVGIPASLGLTSVGDESWIMWTGIPISHSPVRSGIPLMGWRIREAIDITIPEAEDGRDK